MQIDYTNIARGYLEHGSDISSPIVGPEPPMFAAFGRALIEAFRP